MNADAEPQRVGSGNSRWWNEKNGVVKGSRPFRGWLGYIHQVTRISNSNLLRGCLGLGCFYSTVVLATLFFGAYRVVLERAIQLYLYRSPIVTKFLPYECYDAFLATEVYDTNLASYRACQTNLQLKSRRIAKHSYRMRQALSAEQGIN